MGGSGTRRSVGSPRGGTHRGASAIAWILRQRGVLTIPKSASADRVRENRGALDVQLTHEDLDDLDREFPPAVEKSAAGGALTS